MPLIGEILMDILIFGFAIPAAFYLKGKYFFRWNRFELRLMLIMYYLALLVTFLIKKCSCLNDINMR